MSEADNITIEIVGRLHRETLGDRLARLEAIRRAAISVIAHTKGPDYHPPLDKLNALGLALFGDSWTDAAP